MTKIKSLAAKALLVVVGILVVLMAILLPVLRKAREKSDAVKCASNLRQIAVAMALYREQNDGRFAYAGRSRVESERIPRLTSRSCASAWRGSRVAARIPRICS